jgi:hypothetical protein
VLHEGVNERFGVHVDQKKHNETAVKLLAGLHVLVTLLANALHSAIHASVLQALRWSELAKNTL